MARGSKLLVGLAAVFGAFGGLALGAGADDAAWEDARGARLDARIAAMEAARRAESVPLRTPSDDPAGVDLEHGDARFVGEIARVDITLDVTNRGDQPMEWARTLSLDPQAEV